MLRILYQTVDSIFHYHFTKRESLHVSSQSAAVSMTFLGFNITTVRGVQAYRLIITLLPLVPIFILLTQNAANVNVLIDNQSSIAFTESQVKIEFKDVDGLSKISNKTLQFYPRPSFSIFSYPFRYRMLPISLHLLLRFKTNALHSYLQIHHPSKNSRQKKEKSKLLSVFHINI